MYMYGMDFSKEKEDLRPRMRKSDSKVSKVVSTSSSSSMELDYDMPLAIEFNDKSFESASLNLTGQKQDILKRTDLAPLLDIRTQLSKQFQDQISYELLEKKIILPSNTCYVFIESTDSDFHYGAKRVVMIHCYDKKDGKKLQTIFYKPHSVQAEKIMFSREDSIFAKFGLPTLEITDMVDYGIESDAGIIKEMQSSNSINYKMERCVELGKIAALSELFGIGDLHMENIVLTKDGVTIIDGEFVFCPDIMLGKISSCLAMLDENLIGIGGNYKMVPSGGMLYCLYQMGLNYKKLPKSLFMKIVEGYQTVIQTLNIKDFKDAYAEIKEIRITPLATGMFVNKLLAYWDKNKSGDDKHEEIEQLSIYIYSQIANMGYWNKEENKMIVAEIAKNIEISFENGYIPRFSFLPQQNKIAINNISLSQITLYRADKVENIFTRKKTQLEAMQSKDFIKHIQQQYHIDYNHTFEYLKTSILIIVSLLVLYLLYRFFK